MTNKDTLEPGAAADDEPGLIEDAIAALTPAAEDILAGIGAGDHSLQTTLLATMPTGTAALLRSQGALTDDRKLTDFGVELAEQVAFQHGVAPDPDARAVVAWELAQRATAAGASHRRWKLRPRDDRPERQPEAAEVRGTAHW